MIQKSDLIKIVAAQIIISKGHRRPQGVALDKITSANAKREAEFLLECLDRSDEEWAKVNKEDIYYIS